MISELFEDTRVCGRTYYIVSWTEGVNLRLVFVGLETLDRDLQEESASSVYEFKPV